jgi:uncharacterized protein
MVTDLDAAPPGARKSPEELERYLSSGGRSAVALSGGVDSAVVAWVLRAAVGEAAYAVTLRGPAVSADEVARAAGVARAIGIRHAIVSVDPLGSEPYRSNPSNRCYFCRTVETARIREWGEPIGIVRYVDGVHRDDLGDDRPGLRAMDEAGFLHPLLWAGWGKVDVRAFARSVGLPNADQPSDACLASRVRHGQHLSTELLGKVERAERAVRARGFRRVRVRVDGAAARVEVDPDEVGRLLSEPLAGEVRRELAEFGFDPVELDPSGYRPRAGA